jgi:hypothetical protein
MEELLMKKIMLLTACLISAHGLLASATVDNRLLGSWKSKAVVYELDDSKVFLDIQLMPTKAILTSNCLFKDGTKLASAVDTTVEYNDTVIKALESKDNVTEDHGKQCPSFIRPSEIVYKVLDDKNLTLNYKEMNMIVQFVRK